MTLEIVSILIAGGALLVSVIALLRPDKDKRRMADAWDKMAARGDETAVNVRKLSEFVSKKLVDTEPNLLADYAEATTGIARRGGTWIVEPLSRNRFSMRNGSDHQAFDVRLEMEGVAGFDPPEMPIRNIAPDQVVQFSVFRAWGANSPLLRVTWANDNTGVARQTWERALG
ncbi:MAG: hypothetical protein ACRCYX_00980 [Dermatophilaceae bacterium]